MQVKRWDEIDGMFTGCIRLETKQWLLGFDCSSVGYCLWFPLRLHCSYTGIQNSFYGLCIDIHLSDQALVYLLSSRPVSNHVDYVNLRCCLCHTSGSRYSVKGLTIQPSGKCTSLLREGCYFAVNSAQLADLFESRVKNLFPRKGGLPQIRLYKGHEQRAKCFCKHLNRKNYKGRVKTGLPKYFFQVWSPFAIHLGSD